MLNALKAVTDTLITVTLPDIDPTTLSGNYIVVGLDGEMSSANLAKGGRLIQAGFSVLIKGKVEIFSQLLNPGPMEWDINAQKIHGFSQTQIESALSALEVDELAYQWLLPRGGMLGEGKLIPVGFNVGSFDMPFFLESMPKTASLFSRRSIDLNALCFSLEGMSSGVGKPKKFTGWKKAIDRETKKVLLALGYKVVKHDAGSDAAQALLGWIWIRGILDNKITSNLTVLEVTKNGKILKKATYE